LFYYNFGQFANDMYSNVPPTSGLKFTKSSSIPSGAVNGDEWYNTSNNTIYKYIDGNWIIMNSLTQYISFINSKLGTLYTSETLLYDSAVNGFSNTTFHSLCDNMGPNITIITTTTGVTLWAFTSFSLNNSYSIKEAALKGDADIYTDIIKNLIPVTAADHAASFVGANVARVTDNHDLAKVYFNQSSPLQTLRDNPANFTANQNINLRKEAKGLRKLVATGAPIAIPGLLNVVADTYVPGNIAWTPPQFKQSVVNYVANANVSTS
jgi:hypothetical protein